jgi:hypothetical protein
MTMAKTSSAGEDQKKIAAVVAFVVIAAAIFYFEYFYTGTPSTPEPVATVPVAPPVQTAETAAPVTTGAKAARSLGTTSAALDPTLHMDAMLVSESVVYAGFGRNIFSPNSAPPMAIPQPKGPARPLVAVAPVPVAPPVIVPCPPNCPPIDLKFFGVETGSNGARKALLLHGEDVFVASPGEIVMRRYRVVTVDAKTIEVEDMQNNNKQTLPLLVN